MSSLFGKKILYIGLNYFDYPIEIKNEIEKLGGNVDYFPIFKKGLTIKIIRRFSNHLTEILTNKYYTKILNSTKRYDIIFFISIHWIPLGLFKKIKEKFTDSEFILYNWDSIETHNYDCYLKYFDKVFSFDKMDCLKIKKVKYLPLFFCDTYRKIRQRKKKNKLVFVGRFNNIRRYNYLKKICNYCEKEAIEFNHYLNINFLTFLKICIEQRRLLDIKMFKFKKLKLSQIIEKISDANCIIDIPNNSQSGLTMRIIECLGAHIKLITFNKNVINEPIFNEEIIFIANIENFNIDKNFLTKNISNSSLKNIDKYSLNNWVKKIFD